MARGILSMRQRVCYTLIKRALRRSRDNSPRKWQTPRKGRTQSNRPATRKGMVAELPKGRLSQFLKRGTGCSAQAAGVAAGTTILAGGRERDPIVETLLTWE